MRHPSGVPNALANVDQSNDPAGLHERWRIRVALTLGLSLALFSISNPEHAAAQNRDGETDDEWSQPATLQDQDQLSSGWSLRTGIGFMHDPTAFLLNLEVPYKLDRWVSIGPMMQVGLDDDNTVVAPTLDVTVTIPNLPGGNFDRIDSYFFAGIGFAYLKDDSRSNNKSSTGFLVNFGLGLEYELREHLYLGSQMTFNFLPGETLDEKFFYSWQIAGLRIAF